MKKSVFPLLLVGTFCMVLFGWWNASAGLLSGARPDILLALGRLTGLLAAYFVLLQFVLIGRATWLEQTFGLDKLTILHRLNGFFSITFILLHPSFITLAYAQSFQTGFLEQYLQFVQHVDDLLPASIAVALFLIIVVSSVTIARKRLKYESWYAVHLLTYLAVLLSFGHQLELGGDFVPNRWFSWYWAGLYALVFGNLLAFRFIRPIWHWYVHRFTVSRIVQETSDTVSVYITGKQISSFHMKPGQFMIVRFLTKGFWYEAHPFSLSAVPSPTELRLTIKNSGDFTSRIPSLTLGTSVFIDGPYGVFTAQPQEKSKYLFIAGGVGITPIRALIEQVSATNDVVLLYASKTRQDIIFQKELETISKTFPFSLHYVLNADPDYPGEKGHVDQEKIARLVPDVASRHVYLCGPPPMMHAVRQTLATLGVPKKYIHFERFAL